jgi:hypothetical protein
MTGDQCCAKRLFEGRHPRAKGIDRNAEVIGCRTEAPAADQFQKEMRAFPVRHTPDGPTQHAFADTNTAFACTLHTDSPYCDMPFGRCGLRAPQEASKMKHLTRKNKPAIARRSAARSRNAGAVAQKRSARAQAALRVLFALLHADRWIFEAGELAKKSGMAADLGNLHDIRLSIVKSLNEIQPLAYGAMGKRDGAVKPKKRG